MWSLHGTGSAGLGSTDTGPAGPGTTDMGSGNTDLLVLGSTDTDPADFWLIWALLVLNRPGLSLLTLAHLVLVRLTVTELEIGLTLTWSKNDPIDIAADLGDLSSADTALTDDCLSSIGPVGPCIADADPADFDSADTDPTNMDPIDTGPIGSSLTDTNLTTIGSGGLGSVEIVQEHCAANQSYNCCWNQV